jgi:hypothetical protein
MNVIEEIKEIAWIIEKMYGKTDLYTQAQNCTSTNINGRNNEHCTKAR